MEHYLIGSHNLSFSLFKVSWLTVVCCLSLEEFLFKNHLRATQCNDQSWIQLGPRVLQRWFLFERRTLQSQKIIKFWSMIVMMRLKSIILYLHTVVIFHWLSATKHLLILQDLHNMRTNVCVIDSKSGNRDRCILILSTIGHYWTLHNILVGTIMW